MELANGSVPALKLDRIRVQFGKLMAVGDVSFSLNGGDLLGLIGPNGAGKTTLLRAIAGLQPLTRGVVTVVGQSIDSETLDGQRHIGFTPDTPGVYEELTVRQFLIFIAMGYDLTRSQADERIDFWLDKVWLSEKAETKIKSLSRGMRQRVGIARTLLPNPSIILLDEPAAGLDPAGRVQFRRLLCDLRDQGKALIVSSHILADMGEYCTHIGMMSGGEMVRFGTVQQVSGHSENSGRCRYTIMLARPVPRLQEFLSSIELVSEVSVDRDQIVLEYDSDREAAARLLKNLLAMDIPVASFAPNTTGLEEAYLKAGIRQVD